VGSPQRSAKCILARSSGVWRSARFGMSSLAEAAMAVHKEEEGASKVQDKRSDDVNANC
jgi:hypothetical protein